MSIAKRYAEHAIYHMDTTDPIPDLDTAIVFTRIEMGELTAADADIDLEDVQVPGSADYPCPATYGRDCGYRGSDEGSDDTAGGEVAQVRKD